MHNVIETIHYGYNYPVNSVLQAVQAYNEDFRDSGADYGNVLRSLLGIDCQELEDPNHARVQVGYVIQLAVAAHVAGEEIDPNSLYVNATAKAREFAREMSWAFAKKEAEEKLDENGRPRPKKGSKGERSYELYCEMVAAGNATRKAVMEAFQDEEVMGMQPHTKKGASSYFYIVKTKYEKLNG